jgi:signal transduction histidine kinase
MRNYEHSLNAEEPREVSPPAIPPPLTEQDELKEQEIQSECTRLLVVDDEESVAVTISEVLRRDGYSVDLAFSGAEAIKRIQECEYDLVLTDLHMEATNGLSVLAELRRTSSRAISIVLTGFASLESAIAAIRHGAYDYLIKPCVIDDLKLTIRRGLEHRRLLLAEQEARADLEQLARQLEQRVDERTAELRRVNEELERANKAKDIFFAMLSHELRTPLTPILGWTKLLRHKSADAELFVQGLDAIERNTVMQARLIDDLLDISRVVSGKLHVEMEPTDICAVVEAAVQTVREKAEARGVELTARIPEAPLIVQGAPVRLQQIVWNLLSNAIKFTAEGGRVEVDVDRTDLEARIVVADNGKGIEPAFLPHVFNLFSQSDVSMSRDHGGLGLGLAIVARLAELHGGVVIAESDGVGKGAQFTVVIPRATSGSLGQQDEIAAGTLDLHGPVLIVDDSPDTLEMMRVFFTQFGCRVLAAASAEDALALAASERPGVVISDIGMPGLDGYELIAQLRGIAGLEAIPAIALSGYAMDEDLQRALDAGFSSHVAKPVDPERLLPLIRKLTSS